MRPTAPLLSLEVSLDGGYVQVQVMLSSAAVRIQFSLFLVCLFVGFFPQVELMKRPGNIAVVGQS